MPSLKQFVDATMRTLKNQNVTISDEKPINYGYQFLVKIGKKSGVLRLYMGKKGQRVDVSMIKDAELLSQIAKMLNQPIPVAKEQKKAADIGWPLIGIDESGKGDYFGPLVTCGVMVDAKSAPVLQSLGVKDSKTLDDTQMSHMAREIVATCPSSLLILDPPRYNETYKTIGNLNTLLAQCHVHIMQQLVAQTDCRTILSDQFASPAVLETQVQHKQLDITLHQQTKAESNLAVAAASIVARATFVSELSKLSSQFSQKLPKGATHVSNALHRYVDQNGKAQLNQVAKLHFKLTGTV